MEAFTSLPLSPNTHPLPPFPPQLFERWQRQGIAAPESAPVMEAFTSLAVAMRDRFEPFAAPVFEGAMTVVRGMREAKAAQVRGERGAVLFEPLHLLMIACAGLCVGPAQRSTVFPPQPPPQAAGRPPPAGIPYEADTYMAALDLLSGLCDGLRAGAEPLIAASGLAAALPDACRDEAPDVRQSAFALVGDLARWGWCGYSKYGTV